jgi:hypothetical protein
VRAIPYQSVSPFDGPQRLNDTAVLERGSDEPWTGDRLQTAIFGENSRIYKKAVFNLQQQHPPTLVLSEVEVELCSMVRTIVLAGNAALKAEMTLGRGSRLIMKFYPKSRSHSRS